MNQGTQDKTDLHVRVSDILHRGLRLLAAQEGLSIQEVIERMLTARLPKLIAASRRRSADLPKVQLHVRIDAVLYDGCKELAAKNGVRLFDVVEWLLMAGLLVANETKALHRVGIGRPYRRSSSEGEEKQ